MHKIIVTHNAPDLDAVCSSWLIKRFLPGWQDAEVATVPAGSRINTDRASTDVIEHLDGREVIHVDTGLGPLDHHQISNDNTCGAKLTFDYVVKESEELEKNVHKREALKRMVEYVVDDDHFQEVFYPNPLASVYEFSLVSLLAGIKVMYPKDDQTCLRYGFDMLDTALYGFEHRIWAEEEIKEKGVEFETLWGKSIGIETINDEVLKLAQMMGYVIAVRKDPLNGGVRIKARPKKRSGVAEFLGAYENVDVDLTPIYEALKRMDPEATWFLHISRRMLLNGSSKSPNMKGSKLSLQEVIDVLKNV